MITPPLALIEWDGKEYEYKYSFQEILRMKTHGINFARLYRLISTNPESVFDEADEVCRVIHFVLRSLEVEVTHEEVWKFTIENPDNLQYVVQFFFWIGSQHFGTSPDVEDSPSEKSDEKPSGKKQPPRKKKTSR